MKLTYWIKFAMHHNEVQLVKHLIVMFKDWPHWLTILDPIQGTSVYNHFIHLPGQYFLSILSFQHDYALRHLLLAFFLVCVYTKSSSKTSSGGPGQVQGPLTSRGPELLALTPYWIIPSFRFKDWLGSDMYTPSLQISYLPAHQSGL